VNCTTIDWFLPWPDEAFRAVASSVLMQMPALSTTVAEQAAGVCVVLQQGAQALSERYRAEQGRHFYVTPTSYLEMLALYKKLLAERMVDVSQQEQRYANGLQMLWKTEGSVGKMQEQLTDLQPQLITAKAEAKVMIEKVTAKAKDADEVRSVVKADETIANEKAAASNQIKAECESDLQAAMPALNAALKALNTVTKKDIDEIRSFKSPPATVKMVMETVCIMLDKKPVRARDENGAMKNDYWDPSKKLLGELHFMSTIIGYDKDNTPEVIIKKLQPYLANPDFKPEVVKRVSLACFGLCAWVRAMDTYYWVSKEVAPKKAKLKEAQKEYKECMAELKLKQGRLKEV
jgi:dynein heavy chain